MQMWFYEEGLLEKLLFFYKNFCEKYLITQTVLNLKFAELLSGCIMNATQVKVTLK